MEHASDAETIEKIAALVTEYAHDNPEEAMEVIHASHDRNLEVLYMGVDIWSMGKLSELVHMRSPTWYFACGAGMQEYMATYVNRTRE